MQEATTELLRFNSIITYFAEGFRLARGRLQSPIRLPDNFHHDEASSFLAAFEEGLLKIAADGRCSLPHFDRTRRKPTEPCLFGFHKGDVVLMWREYIMQVGAAAELVLRYGWPPEAVALDPDDWAFDIATYTQDKDGFHVAVAGEVKKTVKELDKTLDAMLDASGSKMSPGMEKHDPDGRKKYRGVLRHKPSYFWAVAPGARRAFRVRHENGAAFLEEAADVPVAAEFLKA